MFAKLDGRTVRSIRVTIIFILLISVGGNIIFFIDKYKDLEFVRFYYYRGFLEFVALLSVAAIASGFEVANSLSNKEKSKYKKNIIYYICGGIIFLSIGLVQNKLSNSVYMIFAGVINAGLIMLLYFISRNIWIISVEQESKENKYFAPAQSYDYKVEPSWRWKIWFKPIIKSNIKDEEISSNALVMKLVMICVVLAVLSLLIEIWVLIIVVVVSFTIEDIFNLNTVLFGTCMGIEVNEDSEEGSVYYSLIVTDFTNKRECKIYYGENIPPYREGDKLKVVMTLITRRKKSVRYIRQ